MPYKMYRLSSDIAWPCTDCTVLLLLNPCVRVCVYRGRLLRERRRVTVQFYASDNAPQVFEYRPWLWEPKHNNKSTANRSKTIKTKQNTTTGEQESAYNKQLKNSRHDNALI